MISSKLISANKAKEVWNLYSENLKALKKEIAVFLQYPSCKGFWKTQAPGSIEYCENQNKLHVQHNPH